MVLWRAKEATILIGSVLSSVSATASLESQLSSGVDYSGKIKNIEISGAEADTETVFLFGANASGQQNAEIEEQNMTQREFSATLVYSDSQPMALASTTGVAVGTTGYTRYSGDTTRTAKSVLVSFTDGTNHAAAFLNNAFSIKLGDISLDAEGHAEQSVTLKCLAKDYQEEDDF